MSKLDFSRQIIPLGDHPDVHDIIAGFRTSGNLSSISEDLLNNGHSGENHDNERVYSPTLINYDENVTHQGADGFSQTSYSSENYSIPKDRNLFDSALDDTFPTSTLTAGSSVNTLKSGYRRAQDVSLAALPTQWRCGTSPNASSPQHPSSFEDVNHSSSLFNRTVHEQQPSASRSSTKQLTTLRNLDKRLDKQSRVDDRKWNSSLHNWSESRRRYFSFNLHGDSYTTASCPLSTACSLPIPPTSTYECSKPEVKRDNEFRDIFEQYLSPVDCHKSSSYDNNYPSSESVSNFSVSTECFSATNAIQSSSQDLSYISTAISPKFGTKEKRKNSTLSPVISDRPYVPSLPDSNVSDSKIDCLRLRPRGTVTNSCRRREEVAAIFFANSSAIIVVFLFFPRYKSAM